MAEITPPPVEKTPTLGLCVITKTMTEELMAQLVAMLTFVDQVYVQVNGDKLAPHSEFARIHISYFDWRDDFAAARNALQAEVKTDYWTWMDTDDTLRHPEQLRVQVGLMEAAGTAMVFAPYEYNTKDSVVTELQYRERLIRTATPGEWHGVIHETWIPASDVARNTTEAVIWVHHITKDSLKASMLRNRRILESEYSQEPRDPRISYYLGLNYGMDKHYEEAINCFLDLIDTGGWDEEIYRAWLQIFSCYFELGSLEPAELAAHKAMSVLPEWPDAYFMLQQLYYQTDEHEKSLEWYKVGVSKPQPVSDSAFNPVVRWYQPLELAAYSYLATGQAFPAQRTLRLLQAKNSAYPIKEQLARHITEAVADEYAIGAVKTLVKRLDPAGAQQLLLALPADLKSDIRLTDERRRYIPGKTWPKGSIVFYCGPSFEDWGPDTLGQGMGGSEEAVVYLARELSKRTDMAVTVFNQRSTPYLEEQVNPYYGVNYSPWTEINPNDEFDVFVAWRSPAGIENIKARRKLVDLHDIIDAELVYRMLPHVDKYLFKSNFHRELYPDVPDDKAAIIGNGLVKGQFV